MKLAKITTYRYSLPLRRALTSASQEMTRHGFVIEVCDEAGHRAYGECSPLPGFSRESTQDVAEQLKQISFGIAGSSPPDNLEELSGQFEQWLGKYSASASVRFAVESAVLSLIASNRNVSLSRLLSDGAASTLPVNALLSGDRDTVVRTAEQHYRDGFTAFKLKVGGDDVREDIELAQQVRQIIGDDARLRLDANRKWDVNQVIDFWNAAHTLDIEYIEEPVADHAALVKEMTKVGLPSLVSIMLPPTALDESIVDADPDNFFPPPGVKAIILKPTLLGLECAMRWARKALRTGLTPVVTSAYETSLGISSLAHFAASLSANPVPMGLATLDVFERDLLQPSVGIEHGTIHLDKLPDANSALRRDVLELVSSHG